ncbi:MAG: TerD family protein [Ruminococcus sp.]|uniref:TerD family protein n=1 Tax=Ruminococcus sp. TaxID=41978 RepID=UPI0025F2BCA1|nr:TerD family protein [Ruminococcus sp.]MBO4865155.1 TerD family protein [Ruminococcus sp.]
MSLLVPMITRGALGRNDLLNNYGTTNFVQPPINDLTGLMNRGAMMGGMPGMGMGGMSGMGGGIVNPSSVGGFVTGAAVGAVAMSAMQNGGLNGVNSIDHPNGGMNRNMNQPQNGYQNNGYNNQPQNGYQNNGYNNQPQNGYQNNGYNNQPQNGYQNNGYNNQPQNGYQNNGSNNQPQNGYQNNGYNNQPQNGYQNNGYNNQPQNGYQNNGYNNQPSGDPLDAIFAQPVRNHPQPPQQNQQQGAWEPVRNTPRAGQTNFGVQQPVNNAPASYASNPANSRPNIKRNRAESTGDRLAKGQKYSVKDRDGRPAEQLKICLGWDVKDGRVELDASAFMLGDNGKVPGDEWFIFYGQPDSPDNGLHYKIFKDDPNSPDDAAIIMDLSRVDQRVTKIALAVTIYEAGAHSLNFGMVQNLYARILDSRTNREIACFKMDECYSSVTAMVLGELYRYKGEWKFNAVGSGVNKDLAAFCGMYGVALE